METILISSNQLKSELRTVHCSSKNNKIIVRADDCFNDSIELNVIDINGNQIHQESGNYFTINKEYTLETELCQRGIYIVKIGVNKQSFVETLYHI